MIYPWQTTDWSRITRNPGQSHHGILLSGRSGIGKREFAVQYCQHLLCDQTTPESCEPCGQCRNCRLFTAATHPDFHVLTTQSEAVKGRCTLISRYSDRYHDSRERKAKPGQIISIDQIRLLIERFATHSHISANRVALILPADAMNTNAANALLKLLEEPPSGALFVLVTAEPDRLPATIRSRCMSHVLATPDRETALGWLEQEVAGESAPIALKLASGGPVDAKTLADEGLLEMHRTYLKGLTGLLSGRVAALELASQLSKMDFGRILTWLQQSVIDLVKWRQTEVKPDWVHGCEAHCVNASIERLYQLYDRINRYRRISRDPLNQQLAIEDLLLTLQKIVPKT